MLKTYPEYCWIACDDVVDTSRRIAGKPKGEDGGVGQADHGCAKALANEDEHQDGTADAHHST